MEWTSPSIDILAAGYSGFGEYPIGHADHRMLWIDISAHSCFGLTPPTPNYRLESWMSRQTTSPELAQAVIQSLTTWHDNPTIEAGVHPNLPDELQTCLTSQHEIGWSTFLFGFISNHWIDFQQAYYTSIDSRRTGFRWGCSLFSEVIKIPWALWRHRCKLQQDPHSLSNQDEHRRLDALIQAEYDKGTLGWRHRNRRWFKRPTHDLFSEALSYKQSWLQSVMITRERHNRRLANPHVQQQRIMQQFLQPPPPLPHP